MPGVYDFDDGNGVYDVVTRKDYERWEEKAQVEKIKEQRRIAFENGEPDPFFFGETPF